MIDSNYVIELQLESLLSSDIVCVASRFVTNDKDEPKQLIFDATAIACKRLNKHFLIQNPAF